MLQRHPTLSRERLTAAMARQGVTQQGLGEHIGYSLDSAQPTVSKILAGRAQPSLEKLIQIAMYLNTSLDYLLELTDEPGPAAVGKPGEAADVAFVETPAQPSLAGLSGCSTVLPAEGSQPFRRRQLLETQGIDPNRSKVFRVVGDSMMPTLPHGCTILVDYTRAVPAGEPPLRLQAPTATSWSSAPASSPRAPGGGAATIPWAAAWRTPTRTRSGARSAGLATASTTA